MERMIVPFGEPFLGPDEEECVADVIKDGWLSQGKRVQNFETAFAHYCGSKFAIAVNSCASALLLTLKALRITLGDQVIVPALTHPATANACVCLGAKPVFCDVDSETYNIDVEKMKEAISDKTKVVIPVHFAGHPCDIYSIYKTAKANGIFVVEDAAHSIGSEYDGNKIGSFGNPVCFSFYPTKNMTTGEGGMITTDDEQIAWECKIGRAHGVERPDPCYRPWYYETIMLGYNFRMTEIQASIGQSQLKKLDEMNERRIHNANHLISRLREIDGIVVPTVKSNVKHVFHVLQIRLEKTCKVSRDQLIQKLREKRIGTSVYYPLPVPLHKFYRATFGYQLGEFPVSEMVCNRSIALPVQPSLKVEQLNYMVECIQEILREN